ncbi:hypothetical protein BJ165DRAFT_1514551 [Panaeolus papilionaceus]|nr:hypothetical protein BJ165DRAFT_1514551 [Panaeolus papilionaceus]
MRVPMPRTYSFSLTTIIISHHSILLWQITVHLPGDMSIPEYTTLKIMGDISVELVTGELPEDACLYILVGPTGGGKSRFIQALAGDFQDLGISKDQLAGFTQKVSMYRLVNVLFQFRGIGNDRPIYLIDTPGFSDPKLSNVGVLYTLGAVSKELQPALRSGNTNPGKILFMTPITETRMPGTKRRTIDLLTALVQPSKGRPAFTIVTTMWDKLYTERARQRAEASYEQLRDDIFKVFIDNGATIEQFINTRSSALNILDKQLQSVDNNGSSEINVEAYNACIYRDLHERIEGALQRKQMIQADLAHPEVQKNLELKALLESTHLENEETLTKFAKEFLLPAFPPPGFEDAHYRLLKSLLGTYIPNTTFMRIFILRYHLTGLVRSAKRRGSKWFKPKA